MVWVALRGLNSQVADGGSQARRARPTTCGFFSPALEWTRTGLQMQLLLLRRLCLDACMAELIVPHRRVAAAPQEQPLCFGVYQAVPGHGFSPASSQAAAFGGSHRQCRAAPPSPNA